MGKQKGIKPAIDNRKARHNYHIKETFEAGLVLAGTEVRSLRMGKGNLQDAYAAVKAGEVWAYNFHISPYDKGNRFNHDPLRPKKLLLNRREIDHLVGMQRKKGCALIPLKIYFKDGLAKMEIAVVVGKKLYDKREDITSRDAQRAIDRAMKERGHMTLEGGFSAALFNESVRRCCHD